MAHRFSSFFPRIGHFEVSEDLLPTTDMSTSNGDDSETTATMSSKNASQVYPMTEEGKNSKFIKCAFCSCLILRPNMALMVEFEKMIPKIDSEQNDLQKETHFWLVEDIYHFENMSFSNTVENMKFLSCCDCEIGPIGYQDLENDICYVTSSRVIYTDNKKSKE